MKKTEQTFHILIISISILWRQWRFLFHSHHRMDVPGNHDVRRSIFAGAIYRPITSIGTQSVFVRIFVLLQPNKRWRRSNFSNWLHASWFRVRCENSINNSLQYFRLSAY